MSRVSFFVTTAVSLIMATAFEAQGQALSRDEAWRSDINQLLDQAAARHPDLYNKVPKDRFDQERTSLLTKVPELTNAEIVMGMQKILAMAGDGHTSLSPFQAGTGITRLPLRFYWFADGIYAVSAAAQYAGFLGKRLVAIEGVPIQEVVDRITPLISHENSQWIRSQAPIWLTSPEVLRFVEVASRSAAEVRLTFAENGVERTLTTSAATAPLFSVPENPRPNPPLYRRYSDRLYWYELLNNGTAVYVKYNSAQNSPVLSMASLVEDAFKNVDPTRLRHAIIDLRNNGGGNSSVTDPLLFALFQLKASGQFPIDRVYVIIGRETFSSAILAAIAMKQLGVTLVGEATGNKPSHFGEVGAIVLSNSRLNAGCSGKRFSFPDFPGDTLNPDILAEVGIADYLAERDPVLESILAR